MEQPIQRGQARDESEAWGHVTVTAFQNSAVVRDQSSSLSSAKWGRTVPLHQLHPNRDSPSLSRSNIFWKNVFAYLWNLASSQLGSKFSFQAFSLLPSKMHCLKSVLSTNCRSSIHRVNFGNTMVSTLKGLLKTPSLGLCLCVQWGWISKQAFAVAVIYTNAGEVGSAKSPWVGIRGVLPSGCPCTKSGNVSSLGRRDAEDTVSALGSWVARAHRWLWYSDWWDAKGTGTSWQFSWTQQKCGKTLGVSLA